MRVARVAAQAKINAWLRVEARRGDGYHEIFTLFHLIDVADDVLVRATDSGERTIRCAGPRMPTGGLGPERRNLAYRAAEAYHDRTGWPRGFAIDITKNVPVGGGLGGGSADAAAVLRCLNALAPEPVDVESLQHIAAALGSDVPFFASTQLSAIASGRGEQLSPSRLLMRSLDLMLVVPPFAVATADAYRWLDDDRAAAVRQSAADTPDETIPAPVFVAAKSPWSMFGNDFEPIVERRHPELREIRDWLLTQGATIARLSGSGSTVFGVFEHGLPPSADVAIEGELIPTRTSARVVQVEVLE